MDAYIGRHQPNIHPYHPPPHFLCIYVRQQEHRVNHSHIKKLVHQFQLPDQWFVKWGIRFQVGHLEHCDYQKHSQLPNNKVVHLHRYYPKNQAPQYETNRIENHLLIKSMESFKSGTVGGKEVLVMQVFEPVKVEEYEEEREDKVENSQDDTPSEISLSSKWLFYEVTVFQVDKD